MKAYGRFGLLVPSSNVVVEDEIVHESVLAGLKTHVSRFKLGEVKLFDIKSALSELSESAEEMKDLELDFIVIAGDIISMVDTKLQESEIEVAIERASGGVKSFCASSTYLGVLKSLSIREMNLLTPYTKDLHAIEEKYFTTRGIKIRKSINFGIETNREISEIDKIKLTEELYKINNENILPTFIGCTNLYTFEAIKLLNKAFVGPVISSNLCVLFLISSFYMVNNPEFDVNFANTILGHDSLKYLAKMINI